MILFVFETLVNDPFDTLVGYSGMPLFGFGRSKKANGRTLEAFAVKFSN